eukprot:jgi/Bigna1/85893/estExt_fgenesh1_pg.C_60354
MRSQISFLLTQTGDETANSRRDSKAQRAIDEIRAKMAPPGTIKSDKNDIGGDEATMTPEESTADAAGDVVAVPRPNDDDDDNDEDSKNRTDLNNDNDDGDEDKLRKNKGCNDEKTKDSTSSSSRNSNNTNTGSGITTNNTEKKKESNSNEPFATKEEGGGGSTVEELPNQTDNSEPYVLKEGFLRIETELKESTRYFRIQEKPASPTYLLAWFRSRKAGNVFYEKAIELIESVGIAVEENTIIVNPINQPDIGEMRIKAKTTADAQEWADILIKCSKADGV